LVKPLKLFRSIKRTDQLQLRAIALGERNYEIDDALADLRIGDPRKSAVKT
jgi:hypothetical protein